MTPLYRSHQLIYWYEKSGESHVKKAEILLMFLTRRPRGTHEVSTGSALGRDVEGISEQKLNGIWREYYNNGILMALWWNLDGILMESWCVGTIWIMNRSLVDDFAGRLMEYWWNMNSILLEISMDWRNFSGHICSGLMARVWYRIWAHSWKWKFYGILRYYGNTIMEF